MPDPSNKGTKCGRPKSERKELDGELFKRLKNRKGSPNEDDDEIERHDFQRVKLESFKKGKFRKAFLSVGLAS